MSGRALDYVYTHLEGIEYKMHDAVMSSLIVDITKVLHDLEWALSSDISMDDYYKTVRRFKDKWFKHTNETIKMIFDNQMKEIKRKFYRDFGFIAKEERKDDKSND